MPTVVMYERDQIIGNPDATTARSYVVGTRDTMRSAHNLLATVESDLSATAGAPALEYATTGCQCVWRQTVVRRHRADERGDIIRTSWASIIMGDKQ